MRPWEVRQNHYKYRASVIGGATAPASQLIRRQRPRSSCALAPAVRLTLQQIGTVSNRSVLRTRNHESNDSKQSACLKQILGSFVDDHGTVFAGINEP
jgi:hypothetical protein